MPVKAPRVFEAQVSPADFTFLNRRGFLLGLGALLVPKRSIFLPPLGGWPERPWAVNNLGGFFYDGRLTDKLKMVITPIVRFKDLAEAERVERSQPVRVFHVFQAR